MRRFSPSPFILEVVLYLFSEKLLYITPSSTFSAIGVRKITRIDVVGDKLIVHEEWECNLSFIDLKAKGLDCVPYRWLLKQGFTKILPSWSGFGYALKDGKWFYIDLEEKTIEPMVAGSKLPDDLIRSLIVPEAEWGKWATEIPVNRKDTDL